MLYLGQVNLRLYFFLIRRARFVSFSDTVK